MEPRLEQTLGKNLNLYQDPGYDFNKKKIKPWVSFLLLQLLLAVLVFELKDLHLLDRCSTT
jgi:hypothetical protein